MKEAFEIYFLVAVPFLLAYIGDNVKQIKKELILKNKEGKNV